jgi:hypothetical protein
MKMHGITLAEGADIINLTVDSGTAFPTNPNEGELFYRNDSNVTVKGLYLYVNGAWSRIASTGSLTVPNGATLPTEANEGDLFYRNTNDANEGLYVFKNSSWENISSGTVPSYTISGDVSGTIDGGTDILSLAVVNSNVGVFGSATQAPSLTINDKGLVTAASAVTITPAWGSITSTPTTLAGYGITDAQPLDSDLTALAAVSSTGILARTGAGTAAARTISASGIGVSVSDGDGVSGNPTITSNATSANTASTLVARDASGNFSAGVITASLTGNASTATALQTSRNFSISGDVTAGAVGFDGTGNVALASTLASTGVTAGSYGTSSQVATFTVDEKGRLTAAGSTSIQIAESQISDGIILARNADNETISGTWSFSNPVTVATPTSANHAATKQYVDTTAQGLATRPAVEIATTGNLSATYNNGTNGVGATLTATSNGAFPTIDGITLANTTPGQNGVLVKNQTNPAHNGRYNLTQVGDGSNPWILTRCGLCDEANEIPGSYVFVKSGTLYAGTGWVQTVSNPGTFVVGTDAIFVTQFSGAGSYTAGDGLSLSGTTFNVGTASSSRIVVNADDIDLATTGVTPGTYRSVTVDAYGRATGGTNPTTLAGYGITDAQPLDSDLTAVAGLTTTGFISRTGTGTAVTRSVAVSGTGLSITNADGISGNPTITSNATSGNTVSTIVARDSSGNFSAGNITLAGGAGALTISDSAGTARRISIQTSAVNRWWFGAEGTAESGSNAGSNFILTRFDDGGNSLGDVITITRSTGNVVFSNSVTASGFTGPLTGNASTATALATGRTFSVSGDATGTSSAFDGSANATIPVTLVTVNSSPQTDAFRRITVNSKGLVTATSAVTAGDITTALGYTPVNKAGDTMTGNLTIRQTGGEGSVGLVIGDSVNSGYIQFHSPSNVRQGYIGFSSTDNSQDTGTIPYVAGTHAFTGVISGNGSSITNLNASNLTTGTVSAARLGSGSPSAATFLRGDGTWSADLTGDYLSVTKNTNSGLKITTPDQAEDEKNWFWITFGSTISLRAYNDSSGLSQSAMQFTRTGYTVTGWDFRINNNAVISANSNSQVTIASPASGSHTINGNVTFSGEVYTSSNIRIQSTAPLITLQDTNHMPAFLYNNDDRFYVLRHATPNSTTWDSGPNGRHPMVLNLANGNVEFSGSVTEFSDIRLKKNVQVIENALAKVETLRGVTFDHIEQGRGTGLIAQELQEVLPEAVHESADNGYLTVAYGNTVGLLVEAIKELSAKVRELEAKLAAKE